MPTTKHIHNSSLAGLPTLQRKQKRIELHLVAAKEVFGDHITQQVIDTLGRTENKIKEKSKNPIHCFPYQIAYLFEIPYLEMYWHKDAESNLKQGCEHLYYKIINQEIDNG